MDNFSGTIHYMSNVTFPLQLPKSDLEKVSWLAVRPVSVTGIMSAEEMGKQFRRNEFNMTALGEVACSSACLCSIRIADCLLCSLRLELIKSRVEPSVGNWRNQHGLFLLAEWLGTDKESCCGISNLDTAYEPLMKNNEWKSKEALVQFIIQLETLASFLEKNSPGKIGMLVAHGRRISTIHKVCCQTEGRSHNHYFGKAGVRRLAKTFVNVL
ncbi:hypothetical protein M514_08948, partial [Trichuris suis]